MESGIEQKEIDGKGKFYIEEDGKTLGELLYTRKGNGILNLDHTEVHPEMGGKGLGGKLVKHAVSFARENDLKIKPLCSYAAKQFERHQEYQDVLLRN